MSQKDLLAAHDGLRNGEETSQSLKIKLTLPASFRKRPIETVSRPSRTIAQKLKAKATALPIAPIPKRGRPRKNKNSGEADEYAPPRGVKPQKATVIKASASGPSRLPQHHHQVYHPSPDHNKPRFPTFVPASILSSDDLSASEDSERSDDETEEDEHPEDIVANDRAIANERAHTHRKLFENEDGQIPTRVPWKYNNHSNSRRTTPIVKSPIEIDDGSRSSGNEEDDEQSLGDDEDEDEDEPDVEPDQPTPMQTTTLSDDEEDDTMDAQLFFSHLLDESSGSDDEARFDGDSIMGDIVAGDVGLSDTDTDVEIEALEQPMMVKEGWDGQLVFSTEIHPSAGLVDFTFERNNSQLDLSSSQTDSLANSLSTLPVTQPATISDEEFEEIESLAGDTTDDEIMPPGLASFPPSTSTISPFATFTPSKAMASIHQLTKGAPPSPADVMAARSSFTWNMLSSPVNSIAATDEVPPRSRSASTHSLGYRGPQMGFFNGATFGSMRTIIGDTDGKLPSPFSTLVPPAPTYRRKRRANVCGKCLFYSAFAKRFL